MRALLRSGGKGRWQPPHGPARAKKRALQARGDQLPEMQIAIGQTCLNSTGLFLVVVVFSPRWVFLLEPDPFLLS